MAADAIFGGFVAGYIVSIVDVVVLALAFAKARDAIGWIDHVLSREVPMTLVTIPLFTGSVIVWTAVGLIMGLAFHLSTSEDPDWVLGSSNIVFTVVVGLLAGAVAAAVIVVRPGAARMVAGQPPARGGHPRRLRLAAAGAGAIGPRPVRLKRSGTERHEINLPALYWIRGVPQPAAEVARYYGLPVRDRVCGGHPDEGESGGYQTGRKAANFS
jgi:hypothetical protein